jgi:hypothetical protein
MVVKATACIRNILLDFDIDKGIIRIVVSIIRATIKYQFEIKLVLQPNKANFKPMRSDKKEMISNAVIKIV